jgi:predicted dehydrogenase
MLSSVKLDAVSITVPSDLHAEFTIKALKAGLHVLCEKPMALNIEDCWQMHQAAKKSGKRLMIAHCIRFWPEYANTKQIIDSGQYGKVLYAAFQRFSAMPTWTAGNWVLDDTRSGGMIVDLHIHDSDYICYLFGLPQAVLSWAPQQDESLLPHIHTRYFYDDGKLITAEGSWIMTPSFGFQMAFNIILERATIIYDCTRDPAYKIYTSDGSVLTPSVPAGDGYLHEIIHFAGLITGKKTQEVITLEQSHQALQIVLAECQSIKRQEKICLR